MAYVRQDLLLTLVGLTVVGAAINAYESLSASTAHSKSGGLTLPDSANLLLGQSGSATVLLPPLLFCAIIFLVGGMSFIYQALLLLRSACLSRIHYRTLLRRLTPS